MENKVPQRFRSAFIPSLIIGCVVAAALAGVAIPLLEGTFCRGEGVVVDYGIIDTEGLGRPFLYTRGENPDTGIRENSRHYFCPQCDGDGKASVLMGWRSQGKERVR